MRNIQAFRGIGASRIRLGLSIAVTITGRDSIPMQFNIRAYNPPLRTDVENARLEGSLVGHGLAVWRYVDYLLDK